MKYKMMDIINKFINSKKSDNVANVAELTKNNSSEAYNKLWGTEELLTHYLEPARIDAYKFVANYILQRNFGTKILELGFGSGDFLKILSSEGSVNFDIYGLDYAESGVARAKNIMPAGRFTHGDIYNLPYEDDSFDQVYCLQTLEHLHDPLKAMSEMDRVCRRDAIILVTVPNGDFDNFEGHVNFWNEAFFRKFIEPRTVIDFMLFNDDRTFLVSFHPLKEISP